MWGDEVIEEELDPEEDSTISDDVLIALGLCDD
jgi:hypothetical protein